VPAGVLNVVHGSYDVVNRICDHPDIKAVSLVGSNAAGKHVYSRACAAGKRVQANTGVHMLLCMPASRWQCRPITMLWMPVHAIENRSSICTLWLRVSADSPGKSSMRHR
jgi:Aldehyde dehydrogenase family